MRRVMWFVCALAAALWLASVPVSAFSGAGNAEEREAQTRQEGGARIVLAEAKEGETRPQLAVYALSRAGEPIAMWRVGERGGFELEGGALEQADRIAIGPVVKDVGSLDPELLTVYRPRQFAELIRANEEIRIARSQWQAWFPFLRCTTGSVRHCYPSWWVVQSLVAQASPLEAREIRARAGAASPLGQRLAQVSPTHPLVFPWRCETVCDGVVEVYRKRCCCPPLLIPELEIPELIPEWPPPVEGIKPPRPQPDPVPFSEVDFLVGGTIDEQKLYAQRDARMVRSLRGPALARYLEFRPYLFCTCGPASKVGQGFIQPDGDFMICWSDYPLVPVDCDDKYAYVVKQVINGVTVTIYDGLAANKWFDPGEDPTLVSLHPQAIGCGTPDFPGEGAFALLQHLGTTESWELKTPDATGWDRVATPAYNGGLAMPASSPAAAKGEMLDRNWGGTVRLRYFFSPGMRSSGVDARYYRVSVVRSDGSGNPTGSRTYLTAPVSWKKYEVGPGASINVDAVNLGPQTVGATPNLFRIPYDADETWVSGQYHADLNTGEFAHGRYLLTLEVFDGSGNRIKPQGAPGSDPGTAKPFTFRRWYQKIGPTAEVAYGALTHMMWWDNRSAEALITDLRMNGTASDEECQFMAGSPSSQFSAGYRAYHPEEMFQRSHTMTWHRGLGGSSGDLVSENPSNVGVPPGSPGVSPMEAFWDMLDGETACSFALYLDVDVKTFNGTVTLSGLGDEDIAAFAISQGP